MKRALAALLVLAAVTAVLLEVGVWALDRAGVLNVVPPHRGRTGVWWHEHPVYGAWHHPDSEGEHVGPCWKVDYAINSVGARDAERPRRSREPRVAVLGDSFLEGYGVRAPSRLTEVLEARTGVPHLNFAMASFGPYQQLLVYRDLVTQFDHDAVFVSLLPGNDFADLDLPTCRDFPISEGCYRPYLVGGPPDWRREDHREPALRRLLRYHSWAVSAGLRAWDSWRWAGPDPDNSFFYEYRERHVAVLEEVLRRIVAAAAPRPVYLLLIPIRGDLERWAGDPSPALPEELSAMAERVGFVLVDLLPVMAERDRSWAAYYHSCDYHWSHYGHRVGAELVHEALADSLYAELAQR